MRKNVSNPIENIDLIILISTCFSLGNCLFATTRSKIIINHKLITVIIKSWSTRNFITKNLCLLYLKIFCFYSYRTNNFRHCFFINIQQPSKCFSIPIDLSCSSSGSTSINSSSSIFYFLNPPIWYITIKAYPKNNISTKYFFISLNVNPVINPSKTIKITIIIVYDI